MRVRPDYIDDAKIKEMNKIFSRYPQIQAAYLFGSQLPGKKKHHESDVDVGVFVDRYDVNLKLETTTELTALFNRFDLVMMDSRELKNLVLAYEIVKENRLIYRREDFDYLAFFSKTMRMYFDFVPLLEVQKKYLKKRLNNNLGEKSSIFKKIPKINEYLNNLEYLGSVSKEEFKSNLTRRAAAERFLQLSIEALLDMGNHIIAEKNWGSVDTYRDVATRLYQKGVLNEAEYHLFVKMIGLRNILVHEYLEIEVDVVYDIIKYNLNDIRKILAEISSVR